MINFFAYNLFNIFYLVFSSKPNIIIVFIRTMLKIYPHSKHQPTKTHPCLAGLFQCVKILYFEER